MNVPFVLRTERLGLRPHQLADVPFMRALNADPLVTRYTGDTAFEDDLQAVTIVERLIRQFRERRMGRFVVQSLETGEALGWCGLRWDEDTQVADLGYRFFRKHWGKGLATESARACIDYGFQTLGLPELVATAMEENTASIRVLLKLGFTPAEPATIGGQVALGFQLKRLG